MTATGFIQMIHLKTNKIKEMENLHKEWELAIGLENKVINTTVVEDIENPGWYVVWVEFPNYKEAMINSNHPITQVFAEKLAALCEEGPDFCNLSVVFAG